MSWGVSLAPVDRFLSGIISLPPKGRVSKFKSNFKANPPLSREQDGAFQAGIRDATVPPASKQPPLVVGPPKAPAPLLLRHHTERGLCTDN